MRISEFYGLDRSQPTLDFVDVDVVGDTRIFVDPRALRLLPSSWGDECVALVQGFFNTVLSAIHESRDVKARNLLGVLHEPNETHLGLSRGRARGRAVGSRFAEEIWRALRRSEAVKTGLLEDLEDTILMIEGISSDRISDITTNVIREPLIEYTQSMASYYGIQLVTEVNSGPMWDPKRRRWYSELVSLPVTDWGKLLLVPKVIVRRRLDYDIDEYYRHYLLEYLQEVELSANTELVHLLKDGRRRVTKKDLIEKYGSGKRTIVQVTLEYPEILERYRRDKRLRYQPPLDHIEIAECEGTPIPDWEALLDAVVTIEAGRKSFSQYEKAIESLLTALFYPSLSNPQVQRHIHEGRKRIDITYTNVATTGFFQWLAQHFSAAHIFVECKNYAGDPGNPELDQLAGRFSPSRGQFGLIVCRHISDKELFAKRCRDTANDQRGFIVALDDDDLRELVKEREEHSELLRFDMLSQLFSRLVM